MKLIFYANCQGDAIKLIINKLLPELQVNIISNYNSIYYKYPIDINFINSHDIFLYQPIDKNNGPYSSDYILSHLKTNMIKISFPYIYNTGMWNIVINNNNLKNGFNNSFSMFNENSRISGNEYIEKYDDLNLLYNDFINKKMFFNLEQRFHNSISKLKQLETITTIKISDFIEENYKIIPVFYRDCHPSIETIKELTKRILNTLNINFDINDFDNINNISEFNMLTNGYIPITPYEIKELELKWDIPYIFKEENKLWKEYYMKLFKSII